MADRPIIFSGPMVRALLYGGKTQTRRLFNRKRPYAAVGDRLYVREAAWIAPPGWTDSPVNPMGPWRQDVAYKADDRSGYTADAAKDYNLRFRTAILMPRWASRLTLIVEQVRVERLQDISEDDARAEGMVEALGGWAVDTYGSYWGNSAVNAFRLLWDGLHDKPGERWEDNPWVNALTFRVVRENIDQITQQAA